MRAIRAEGRDVVLGPFPYFFQQTLLVNPLPPPSGWRDCSRCCSPHASSPTAWGWCYLVCYTVFFLLHGKNYYLAPIYPMLLAAGVVVIESAIDVRENARLRHQCLNPAIALVLLASGATSCAGGCAGSFSWQLPRLHEISPLQAPGHGNSTLFRLASGKARTPCLSAVSTVGN